MNKIYSKHKGLHFGFNGHYSEKFLKGNYLNYVPSVFPARVIRFFNYSLIIGGLTGTILIVSKVLVMTEIQGPEMIMMFLEVCISLIVMGIGLYCLFSYSQPKDISNR